MKGGEVEGGPIIRSAAKKDRHSKVYTPRGPRDRRVRLSAHTAIQFYDVQDRLGYDRPSKAVDWLINKARTAIEKLNEASLTSGSDQFSLVQPIHDPPGLEAQELGLSLQTFQESFDGWNMSLPGNSQHAAAPAVFSHLELLQSSLEVNPWHTNAQQYTAKTLDFPFELGFRVPARIYGDEEPQNLQDRH